MRNLRKGYFYDLSRIKIKVVVSGGVERRKKERTEDKEKGRKRGRLNITTAASLVS